jgi:uncharacterized protein (TIGR03435 family)
MRRAFFDFFSGALEKQYGLRLEHREVSVESLVIDSATKMPTENGSPES